ncbi:MAG: thiolase family protein [Acidobacteriota bacterium]
MTDVVVLSSVRTPIGAFQGSLAAATAPELGAQALRSAIERAGLVPADIDQVNMGCVLPAGIGQAPARQATLAAGCPQSTGAVTVNKVCGSGMRTVMMAANDLRCGDFQIVAAGGMESMSNAPYLMPEARQGLRLGEKKLIDSIVHDGLWDVYGDKHMGNCAETCAAHYSFTREEQDAFAEESYRRAVAASEAGEFAGEITPVDVTVRRKTQTVERDEEPFRFDADKARALRAAFQKEGTVTAANASSLSDGASALVLTTDAVCRERGLAPQARVLAHASFAQEPEWFTTAPIGAVKLALERAGLQASDIDLYEINEAFSVVVLACMKELGLHHDQVNVRGGSVALGHPIGASGARIVTTLLHAMEARGARRGCAAICIGGGEATAIILERSAD